ncbi:hypothetical protein OG320_05165 [Microbispora sp. NBC_01189]|uniref:hypothetical protein n=1 Tax=Microbispora sp. NBC_01189 TaxID=2903583 RepID=UPI002E133879|nr:hypothetical protein OG320_05165 [Microbispora sp. NBC_01189]
MRAEQRVWRTADGDLVDDGHPDAAVLAYAAGDELTAADAERYGLRDKQADEPETSEDKPEAPAAKRARRPANKARTPAEDK